MWRGFPPLIAQLATFRITLIVIFFSFLLSVKFKQTPDLVGTDCENTWKTKTQPQIDITSTDGPTPPADRIFGLRVLHEPGETQTFPSNTKIVELIFVHGLGGSAKDTWTHAHSHGFWPDWLHEDSRFNNVRISTFGYNANFKNVLAPQNALGI